MIIIEAYKTSDGKIFDNRDKAEDHQKDIIGELLDELVQDDNRGMNRIDRYHMLINTLENPALPDIVARLHSAIQHSET